MKRKFLLILLAIISAFCLAFGIAACDAASSDNSGNSGNSGSSGGSSGSDTSDKVTSSQWASALGVLNFTCTYNSTYTGTSTNGSVTSTATETSQGTYKVAFTADSNGYISGNAYMSNTYSSTESDSTGESENYTGSSEYYEIVTATSYKQAYREADSSSTSSAEWHSASETISGYEMDDTYVGMLSPVYGLGLEDLYSQFTYSNGAYTATITAYESITYNVTVVISNGYVSSITIEINNSDSEEAGTATYTFTNCGSTTVSVPSEVTALFEETSGGEGTGGDSTGGDSTGGDSTGGDSTGGDSTGGGNTPDPEVPEEEHFLTKYNRVEATCTEDGHIEYWYCGDCGKYFADAEATEEITQAQTVIPASHTLTHYAKVDATCAVAGNIEYWYCSVCGKYFSDSDCETEVTQSQTVIVATGEHNYVDGVCTVCGEQQALNVLAYSLSTDGNYYIVSGIGSVTDTEIEIPSTYNEKPVKEIAASAFADNTKITSVTIADSITSIGSSAFSGCTALESITIGSGVTSIGTYAFYNCTAVTKIDFNAENVGALSENNYAFYCVGQSGNGITVNVGASVTTIPAYLFDPYYSSGNDYSPKITNVVFADESVCTGIYTYAFAYCTALTSINLPEELEHIYQYAFYNCSALTSVIIHDKVETVSGYAFANCTSLESVTIGSGVKSIVSYAFDSCYALTQINYNAALVNSSSSYTKTTYFFRYAGKNSDSLTINIGGSVIGIPDYMFYESYATNIVFADSSVCTNIGEYTFANNTKLKDIVIPDSVTSIGDSAFSGCIALESMTLPFVGGGSQATDASAYTLFGYIFGSTNYSGGYSIKQYFTTGYTSSSYKTYYIPETLTSVTITGGNLFYGAFYDCSSLTSITLGSGVTSIGDMVFSGCSNLVEVVNLSSSITNETIASIASYAVNICSDESEKGTFISQGDYLFYGFSDNYYLIAYNGTDTEITLPTLTVESKDVTYSIIDSRVFSANTKITSVVIPENSVTSIVGWAFSRCTALTSITIPNSVTSIGEYAFYMCSKLESVTIPSGLKIIDRYTFYECTKLTGITIPDGVTSIGNYAFYKCTALTSISIPSSVTSIGDYAFYYCSGITSVTFAEGIDLETIADDTFSGCSALESIAIPESVTSIGDSAFYGCSALATITMPDGITSIGESAFSSTSYYKTTSNWTDSVLYIGKCLIAAKTTITSYSITSGTICIADYAFSYCTSLKSLTISDSVKTIGSYAFYKCSVLTSVTIPASVTYIGPDAFNSCSKLTSVTFEDTTGWYVLAYSTATEGTDLTLTSASDNATYLTSTYKSYYWFKTVATADYVGNTYKVDFTTLTYCDSEGAEAEEVKNSMGTTSFVYTITFTDSENATVVLDYTKMEGMNQAYTANGSYTLDNGTFKFSNCSWTDGSTTSDTSGAASIFGDATVLLNNMFTFGYDGTNVTFSMQIGMPNTDEDGNLVTDEDGNPVYTYYTASGALPVVTE